MEIRTGSKECEWITTSSFQLSFYNSPSPLVLMILVSNFFYAISLNIPNLFSSPTSNIGPSAPPFLYQTDIKHYPHSSFPFQSSSHSREAAKTWCGMEDPLVLNTTLEYCIIILLRSLLWLSDSDKAWYHGSHPLKSSLTPYYLTNVY